MEQFTDSRKLVRAVVTNSRGEASTRYVELEDFRLWEYMMAERHGFDLLDKALCVWLSEAQYREQQDLFDRAGRVRPVTRIVTLIYDPTHHFDAIVNRFVPAEDTDEVAEVLRSHVPSEVLTSDRFDMRIVPGRAIERPEPVELEDLVLGLSAASGTTGPHMKEDPST